MIETGRLLLRPMALEDRDALIAIYSDAEVAQFMSPFGEDEADQRLDDWRRSWRERGYGLMAVLDRATGELLGRSGLYYWPQFDETEVGWLLRRDAWGRGLATEAGRACLKWGFQNFDFAYITSMIDPQNARSIAVADRLGMKPLRDDVLRADAIVVHAIARATWSAEH